MYGKRPFFRSVSINHFTLFMMFRLVFALLFALPVVGFAQKLNSVEEQILKSEAVKLAEAYYSEFTKVIPILKDSITVQVEDDNDKLVNKRKTRKDDFIDRFFPNHDVYVYNDLNPDDDAKRTDRRVLTIAEYLDETKYYYGDMSKEKTVFALKTGAGMKVGYNGQAPDKYYYVQVVVERTMKGMYMGKYYTENTKKLDMYVRTLDKPDTKLKKFEIIGIDFESKKITVEKLPLEEGMAKGIRFFEQEDFEKSFQYLLKYSKEKKFEKNGNATFALGYMYFWGRGTERNEAEMVKWLEASAQRDNLYALHYMGENYYFGEYGVAEDEKKAVKYIKEAAKKGFDESQFWMGERYEKGDCKSLKKDLKDAIKYYKKAAKQGHLKAQAALKRLEKK
ncbi:MAG: sel1 repeat family protein [Bacteroidetes bacterium]|nr:MAG: sel1 repeat family protein [Bacteroidota bacterium]